MLSEIAEGLYTTTHELRLIPGVMFPTRMVIAKLPDGGLWVHSPVALTEALTNEVLALGPVRFLIAPNSFHHLHIQPWAKRFPEAQVWVSPALLKKRPDLSSSFLLSQLSDSEAQARWSGTIRSFGLPQTSTGEHVFLHEPSRSLLVTDLVFNVVHHERWLTRQVFRATGTYGKLAQSRAWRYSVKEKAPFAQKLREVLATKPELLVPAHGEVLDHNVEENLTAALGRWLD
ncbi:MAG: hypothetical protein RJA70_1944 [Pseudomonadota bacterium]|jgi:hypothetical protein